MKKYIALLMLCSCADEVSLEDNSSTVTPPYFTPTTVPTPTISSDEKVETQEPSIDKKCVVSVTWINNCEVLQTYCLQDNLQYKLVDVFIKCEAPDEHFPKKWLPRPPPFDKLNK